MRTRVVAHANLRTLYVLGETCTGIRKEISGRFDSVSSKFAKKVRESHPNSCGSKYWIPSDTMHKDREARTTVFR